MSDSINPGTLYSDVIAYHGFGKYNDTWVDKLGTLLDSGEFIGIYPQGINRGWNVLSGDPDEVEFTKLIVSELVNYSNLEMDKMYGIGSSDGATDINRIAIFTSHFKAIVPCSSQLIEGRQCQTALQIR